MNYKIIKDEKAFLDFIDWLPELEDNETYYLSLFARKKYCPDLIKSNDKTQLKRFTSNKERMYEKVSQLELPIGRWKLKDMSAPQESLVLYINPNPRSMRKATEELGKRCWDLMRNNNYNIQAEALSSIQISKSRGVFVDFDIDTKDVDLDLLKEVFPNGGYNILETRGGYHVMVEPERIDVPNNWYKKIVEMYPVDQTGDNLIPVPGCVQSNFVPKLSKY